MSNVKRRTLLRATAASGAVPAAVSAAAARAAGDRAANVLWIITDDQPRSSLAFMPGTWRKLVQRGQRFTNGYAAVPWCGPARASMLSGLYAHNHECVVNRTHTPFVRHGHDQDTVAVRMAGADYANGYFGKYMNGHSEDPDYVAPGWDRWVANVNASRHTTLFNIDGTLRETVKSADNFAALKCERFISDHTDRPWFAVFAPTAPHDPYTPSPRHDDDFDGVTWDPPALNERNLHDKPRWMRDRRMVSPARMREAWEGKLEELQDLDDQIVRILSTLRATNQLHRTWVFLVSDNGFLLGEHRLSRKEHPYEECTGIPFVVAGPGVAPGRAHALVSQVDLMPSTLEIAGLDPYAGRPLDGRSMVAGLTGGRWRGWRRRLLAENPGRGWVLLREGRWAYIDNHERGGQELYDLDADPHQMRSRHRQHDLSPWRDRSAAFRQATGAELRALEGRR